MHGLSEERGIAWILSFDGYNRSEITMTTQEILGCIFIILSLTASYVIGWVRGVKYGFGVRSFADSIVSRLTNIKVTHTQYSDENIERR